MGSYHGSCPNSCECLCICSTQEQCDLCREPDPETGKSECDDEDTNPCNPYCFGCNRDNPVDNCRVCEGEAIATREDIGWGGRNYYSRIELYDGDTPRDKLIYVPWEDSCHDPDDPDFRTCNFK